jgi:hypothetical protein
VKGGGDEERRKGKDERKRDKESLKLMQVTLRDGGRRR